MKTIRYISRVFAAVALLAFMAGCNPDQTPPEPPEPPNPPPIPTPATPYQVLSMQFAEASKGWWMSGTNGNYTISFDSGRMVIDVSKIRVELCTPETWPVVRLEDGTWHIDDDDTGIAFTTNTSDEEILVIIYDGEGIYVRLSGGGMFFFHNDRVLDVGCFRFEKALNPSLSEDVICNISTGTIFGDLGHLSPGTELTPTFGSRGKLNIGGATEPLTSSISKIEFNGEMMWNLFLDKGERKTSWALHVSYNINVPAIRIDTRGQGAPTSKEVYITVTMTIEDPELLYNSVASETLVTEMRGRGNTTWRDMPKKPYKLKLPQKKRMFGMSDNRHWCLMANYSDKSLLRNCLAFKMSDMVEMSWSPLWVPVELYIDGKYEGQYMLTEQVRTGAERIEVDIVGTGDNSGDALTGGYLFCIDDKDLNPDWGAVKEGFWHRNASGSQFPVAFDEPEAPTPAQIAYAKAYFKEVEDAIYKKSFTEYSKVIDVESVVDFWLVNELARNPDSNMRLSTYLAKPRGEKMYFACVWDFDISFGNMDHLDGWKTDGWWTRDAVWIRQMFRNREFCELVARRWDELYARLPELEPWVRDWADRIDALQRRNFQRWPILGVHVWPNWQAESRTTYTQEIDYMLDFLYKRAEWMNGEIKAGRHRL